MDVTPPPQGRRRPMTRAHARATETEVDSFLFKLHSVSYESRVLPQMETLCILRYFREDREEAWRDHQVHPKIQARTKSLGKEKMEEGNTKEDAEALDTPGA
ncbi:hypothetical protein ACQJBY_001386 [Aegilops geniculata]